MSIQPAEDKFANWDLADRMTKSLRVSGMKVQDMAEYLGVSRGSVGNWINGRVVPSTPVLKLWALRTGAPYEWLLTGEQKNDPQPEGPGVKELPVGIEPTTFSLQGEGTTVIPFPSRRSLSETTDGGQVAKIINFPRKTAA